MWQRHVKCLEAFQSANEGGAYPDTLNIQERLAAAGTQLTRVSAAAQFQMP